MAFDLSKYETVASRLERFYKDHPNGRVETWVEWHDPDFSKVAFGAKVFTREKVVVSGEGMGELVERLGEYVEKATGFAFEMLSQKGVNSTSHVENCETSAIGRALANAGYAPTGGERASREEMEKVERGPVVEWWTAEQKKQLVTEQNRMMKQFGEDEARREYEKALGVVGVAVGESMTITQADQLLTLLRAVEAVSV